MKVFITVFMNPFVHRGRHGPPRSDVSAWNGRPLGLLPLPTLRITDSPHASRWSSTGRYRTLPNWWMRFCCHLGDWLALRRCPMKEPLSKWASDRLSPSNRWPTSAGGSAGPGLVSWR
jgi:hypothetical protein